MECPKCGIPYSDEANKEAIKDWFCCLACDKADLEAKEMIEIED
jgi:endogenous inhibitor of DNA gyrase (YacG/DUF329 family)